MLSESIKRNLETDFKSKPSRKKLKLKSARKNLIIQYPKNISNFSALEKKSPKHFFFFFNEINIADIKLTNSTRENF